MAAAGRILARCHEILRAQGAPGRDHRRARRGRRAVHPLAGRRAGVQGLPRLPRLDLRLAQLDGRARHPGPLRARAAATSSRSTSAWCSTAGWPTPRSPTRSATSRRSPARLLATTRAALFDAVEQCRPGNRLGDVSHAVQTRVEGDGFSVIRSLVGHGIGRDMHEDPQIPNFGDARHRPGAGGGHGAGDRADGQRRARTTCGWARTTGPSTPRTARWRPTSSTPWRSPPRARGSSRPGTSWWAPRRRSAACVAASSAFSGQA